MLVFFIHGVATKDAGYSKRLQSLLKEEFDKRDEPLPHCYGSFWGAVISDKGKFWNWVHQDLRDLKKSILKLIFGMFLGIKSFAKILFLIFSETFLPTAIQIMGETSEK